MNLHAKFDVSRYGGGPKISKLGHVTPSRRKLAKNLRFWGRNGVEMLNFVFGTPKGTSLRETASFDVSIVKIGAGVLAVGCRKNQKN